MVRLSVLTLPFVGGLLLAAASSAQAEVPPPAYMGATPMPRTAAFNVYKTNMLALREEALKQQAADGGALSAEHRAAFQRRIDHVEAVYKRRWHDTVDIR